MEDLAYETYELNDELDYELIGGDKIFMAAAAPFLNHITIVNRISRVFSNYIEDHDINAYVMTEADVYLSEQHRFRPDLIVLCDLNKISSGGERIYGAPDLVVEVLSKSTMYNDLGPKKLAYEQYGVKEYWIVDPWSKRIEVFQLVDGKFVFKGSYMEFSEDDYDYEKLSPSISQIKVSIFDNLVVEVKDVFKWYINIPVKEI